jgi:hypothetical protein
VSAQENPQDEFLESIALAVEFEGDQPLDLQDMWKQFEASMKRQRITIDRVEDASLGELKAKKLTYSHPLKLQNSSISIKGLMWFTVVGKRVWTLDARAEERRFSWLQPLAERVAGSANIQP